MVMLVNAGDQFFSNRSRSGQFFETKTGVTVIFSYKKISYDFVEDMGKK